MIDFDAAEIARGVGELYEPLADEKGLVAARSMPARPLPVHGNRELVSQALANLVDNAIKYAGPPGDAAVNGAPAEIVVERSGRRATHPARGRRPRSGHPGGRPRPRGRALRAARAEPLEPGSGLGLSLAAAVARLHGGELRLEDNAPGLKVMMLLPLSKPNPAPPIPAAI